MNAKQSLKLVAKRLEDVEIVLARAQADIKAYNQCIDSMIAGGSPCDWCEDRKECQLQAKADGKGCSEWWLRYDHADGGDGDEGKGLLSDSESGGIESEALAGKIEAF